MKFRIYFIEKVPKNPDVDTQTKTGLCTVEHTTVYTQGTQTQVFSIFLVHLDSVTTRRGYQMLDLVRALRHVEVPTGLLTNTSEWRILCRIRQLLKPV